jgi:hypothetical protein
MISATINTYTLTSGQLGSTADDLLEQVICGRDVEGVPVSVLHQHYKILLSFRVPITTSVLQVSQI